MEEKTEEEVKETKREKIPPISDYSLGWGIQPIRMKNTDEVIFYLNKFFNNRTVASIICNKKELMNLKRFMAQRKFT
jgi:hypothetical protein